MKHIFIHQYFPKDQLDKKPGQCDVERGMRGLTGVFEGLTLHNKCDVRAYATKCGEERNIGEGSYLMGRPPKSIPLQFSAKMALSAYNE